jgi:hypothetical protein
MRYDETNPHKGGTIIYYLVATLWMDRRPDLGEGVVYLLSKKTKYHDHNNRDQYENKRIFYQSLASLLQPL